MAWATAWRTRMSLNGFFPPAFPYRRSSRKTSKAMYCTRSSPPSWTLSAGAARSLATSCVGGSSTKSTSPESSAASRVAFDLMGRSTTSVTLPSFMPALWPHQSLCATSTVRTSGWRSFTMKAPVPLALRAA